MLKKDNVKKSVILIIFLVLLIVFLFLSLLNSFLILDKKQIYARVVVSDRYGFDINGTALIFGEVTPGGTSSADIIVENKFDRPIKINIFSKGNIKEFLQASENNFILNSGETKKVGFSVIIPEDAEPGTYEGYVEVVTKKKVF